MRPSSLVAVAAFLALVPGTLWVAYAGSDAGLYTHGAIPVVFGLLFTASLVVLFVTLPRIRRRFE